MVALIEYQQVAVAQTSAWMATLCRSDVRMGVRSEEPPPGRLRHDRILLRLDACTGALGRA